MRDYKVGDEVYARPRDLRIVAFLEYIAIAGGARRMLNDTFFFIAPQLERDPLDDTCSTLGPIAERECAGRWTVQRRIA